MEERRQLKQSTFVSWPSPQDYNEAVQNPSYSLSDSSLASSLAETDSLGLPKPNTGMFASVYKMCCSDGDWALRCFLHFVPDQTERYAAIGATLSRHQFSSTLHFDLQERGVNVRGEWFPVLKMQWCEGETLDRWLASNLHDRRALQEFLLEFKRVLSEFECAGIAHGDLQHGNILVTAGKIKFVDYDGMYVPSLCGKISNELGHRDYQHPRRTQKHFGPELDNFSAWVIYLSVAILAMDPDIWIELTGGDDCLIFRRRDFDKPLHSTAFHLLENHANQGIRQAARTLRFLLSLSVEQVPTLSTGPVIPDQLPELLDLLNLSASSRQDDVRLLSTSELDPVEDFSNDASGTGLVYHDRKRQRSRVKGGYTGWRPALSADGVSAQSPPEERPKILSPLAQLVRKVSGRVVSGNQTVSRAATISEASDIPGAQPAVSAGADSPAASPVSSDPNPKTSHHQLEPDKAIRSPWQKLLRRLTGKSD